MATIVAIQGQSGTGKTASLRDMALDTVLLVNVANKPLPFRKKFESVSTDQYQEIIKEIKLTKKKVIVIDDAQYLMANEFMRRGTEKGFDKFTEIAQKFWTLVKTCEELPDDVIVYFFMHNEIDQNGNEKIKTIGKLLDEKITLEGMFTIVLKTCVQDGVYTFATQNNGHDTVKSPMGMFSEMYIDNNLKFVDDCIRNYYEFEGSKTDEEIEEAAEEVKVELPQRKPRGSRKSRTERVAEDLKKYSKEVEEAVNGKEIDVQEEELPEAKPSRRSSRKSTSEDEAPKRSSRKSRRKLD